MYGKSIQRYFETISEAFSLVSKIRVWLLYTKKCNSKLTMTPLGSFKHNMIRSNVLESQQLFILRGEKEGSSLMKIN